MYVNKTYIIGKSTISTNGNKVSKFLCLNSIPAKLSQSWNIIGGKKYGEAKLKEIDEYMLKNKLRYSKREPGRYPPILEPINDSNNNGVLPSVKKVLDKVVPISATTTSTTTTTITTKATSPVGM